MNKVLKGLGEFMLDIFETVIIALSLFVITYLFAFQPHEVNGQSMDGIDNFHTGQYILTDKVTFRFREPERGEVVVFEFPKDESKDYIKRVIALPNESIMINDNKITIYNNENPNGFILDETYYLADDVITTGRSFINDGETVKIPSDSYFVMGDNRTESSDSRTWGFVPKDNIVGRSFFRYWPPNELGLIERPEFEE